MLVLRLTPDAPISKVDVADKEVYTAQIMPIDENSLEFNLTLYYSQ